MLWPEIRKAYPKQWLIIEALEAHTESGNLRQFDCLAVVERCLDGSMAMQRYGQLHRQYPHREFYFVHTSRAELAIIEQQWLGIRRSNAIMAAR